ncbi:hypothetical protein VTL71DRAFT_6573 [Oculimacula yallundae]|uniref:Heterokaryon incompatibility domain-containing protein n=1 Tax=Oculimacula yallundae TaxID=86028 RepID=A0ABR4BY16_9HELO
MSNPPAPAELDAIQDGFRRALMAGMVSWEEEIKVREFLSECLLKRYNQTSRPQDLYNAIEHTETVLRRLPSTSPKLAENYDTLSLMKVSEYGITKAVAELDIAIDMSLKAKEEALKLDLLIKSPDKYFQILNNLGYALSQRHAETRIPKDLDDAIASGRETIRLASKSSSQYTMAMTNLASRLRVRYSVRHNIADHDEAMRLISEQSGAPLPGTLSKETQAVNLYQLAELAYGKYEKDGKLESLDEAIRHGIAAVAGLSIQHEKRSDVLRRVSQMHAFRYDKSKDLPDARNAVLFAKMRVQCLPSTHPATGTHLWQYLLYASHLANASADLADVEGSIKDSTSFMVTMPNTYERQEACQWLLGDLLSRRYTLTGLLQDLIEVVKQNIKICLEHNERASKEGGADIAVEKVYFLNGNLHKIAKAADDNEVKVLITKKLREYFKSACGLNGVPNAPIALYNAHGRELATYADIIEAKKDASIEGVQDKLKAMEIKSNVNDKPEPKKPWRPEEYHTELGARSLAIDPRNKKIIFEMPDLVGDIFGYEDTKPLSMLDFGLREQRLERESRERETSDGKNPNPALCRVCRKLKVLKPTEDGFVWNEKVRFIPFGNYLQLSQRRTCSICSLILTLISDPESHTLHPTLASIDPEVQGTSIEPVMSESGDEILQVTYGLREVGALKVVNMGDYNRTLRQGFQMNAEATAYNLLKDENSPILRPDQKVFIPKLNRWLNDCHHNHGRQCNGELSHPRGVPMMFIDVFDECLVHADSSAKYFALSYVWGRNVKMSETLNENYQDRLKKGGLGSASGTKLPWTIQDAITLVKSLGGRFLWVDALCIVQDDAVNKQGEINKMDTIYSEAFATIVAMSGLDADSGLPGIRPATRDPQQTRCLIVSNRSPSLEYVHELKSNEDILVVSTPISLSLALETSKWESRAWTFQERLLSKRCIYFSKDWAYFQCNKGILNEVEIEESVQGPPSRTLENPLNDLRHLRHQNANEGFQAVTNAYMQLVGKYTVRELSFPGDILNAFNGVFSTLGGLLPGRTVFGLPTALIDIALLWTPTQQLKRRETMVDSPAFFGNPSEVFQSVCPTWSWAGHIGPVEYILFAGGIQSALLIPMIDRVQIHAKDWVYSIRSQGRDTYRIKESLNGSKDPEKRLGWMEDHKPEVLEEKNDIKLSALGLNVLLFEAWTIPLSHFKSGTQIELLSHQEHIHTSTDQGVYRLYDKENKHCGLMFGLPTCTPSSGYVSSTLLVAISRYEETARPHKGPNRVEGEIPMFDLDVYPSIGPGSGMVNALVVSWDGSEVGVRVTVARVHASAWDGAGPEWRLVKIG